MHLCEQGGRAQGGLTRILAVAALAWLAVLIGPTEADVATRGPFRG